LKKEKKKNSETASKKHQQNGTVFQDAPIQAAPFATFCTDFQACNNLYIRYLNK